MVSITGPRAAKCSTLLGRQLGQKYVFALFLQPPAALLRAADAQTIERARRPWQRPAFSECHQFDLEFYGPRNTLRRNENGLLVLQATRLFSFTVQTADIAAYSCLLLIYSRRFVSFGPCGGPFFIFFSAPCKPLPRQN